MARMGLLSDSGRHGLEVQTSSALSPALMPLHSGCIHFLTPFIHFML